MVICVDAPIINVARVPLRNLLRSVPTFKNSFEKFTFVRKSLILIDDSPADLDQISLEVHKYELDLEVVLPPYNKTAGNSLLGIPSLSARACDAFVNVAIKNEVMYKQTAREEETKI